MIDLDNARKVIAAEKCRPSEDYCQTHLDIMVDDNRCRFRPEVADVAEELLAAMKRVQALAAELETTNTTGRLIGKSIRDRLEGTDNA